MGLFNRKTSDAGRDAFGEYAAAVRPWCQRVSQARDDGADVTTAAAIIHAAGDLPKLDVQSLAKVTERDRAIAAARAWVQAETGKLSRQDVLRGRSEGFWRQVGDLLYSDLPVPSY